MKLAAWLDPVPGIEVCNRVDLNQLVLTIGDSKEDRTLEAAQCLNETGTIFVRTTKWKAKTVLRISNIAQHTDEETTRKLADQLIEIANRFNKECPRMNAYTVI